MNNMEKQFKELLNKLLENKNGQFSSTFLFKRLKVKNKKLMVILSEWIDQLIEQEKVDLIHTGKNKKDEILYMTKDFFLEKLKQRLLTFDFLSDENATFSFLSCVSETQYINTDLLVDKIQGLLCPLVRFVKGSRDVPIMLNLYKIFAPERMINISEQMMKKIESESEGFSESKQVKKVMFKSRKKQQNDLSTYQIILTALSNILLEKNKLILTKKEMMDSRGYKVFFKSPNFSAFVDLIQKIYPFKPYVKDDLISFYPENWIDIDQIKLQIKKEKCEPFLQKNFDFLSKAEIITLKEILAPNYHVSEVKKNMMDKQDNSHVAEDEKTFTKKVDIEKNDLDETKKGITGELEKNQKQVNQKKKKTEKSEPLNFLNEIIYKESENNQSQERVHDVKKESKKPPLSEFLIDRLDHFDKREKHFLICILDSTKIESGYYSHSEKDKKFQLFIEKISSSELFTVNSKDEKFYLKRALQISNDKYKLLREKLEESIMHSKNNEDFIANEKTNGLNLQKSKDSEKEIRKKIRNENGESLLDDLVLNENPKSDASIATEANDFKNEDHQEDLIIKKNSKTQKNDGIDLEDIDHESFFEISDDEEEEQKNNFGSKSLQQRLPQGTNEVWTSKTEEVVPESHDLFKEEIKENELSGKIISVLTDDQEKWLKIKMFSEEMGFELRDGLAYKPEIAVFDEGYSHLEPIARNTNAIIMHIDEFIRLLGLGDNH
ncbi:MAG: hypothetical protein U9N62_11100 [Thermotogota bacterium]|nr:hypothetical protein [Thermotogota bacterium]